MESTHGGILGDLRLGSSVRALRSPLFKNQVPSEVWTILTTLWTLHALCLWDSNAQRIKHIRMFSSFLNIIVLLPEKIFKCLEIAHNFSFAGIFVIF